MLIVVDGSLRLAFAIAFVEGKSVLYIVVRQPSEGRLALRWVQDVLFDEIEPSHFAPRRRIATDGGDEAKAHGMLNSLPVARPNPLVAPEVRVSVRSHPLPQPSLFFSHWISSSGSQGLLR